MREIIYLVSSENTGHFYTTTKNKRNTSEKIKMRKYDPVAGKHTDYLESKPPKKGKK